MKLQEIIICTVILNQPKRGLPLCYLRFIYLAIKRILFPCQVDLSNNVTTSKAIIRLIFFLILSIEQDIECFAHWILQCICELKIFVWSSLHDMLTAQSWFTIFYRFIYNRLTMELLLDSHLWFNNSYHTSEPSKRALVQMYHNRFYGNAKLSYFGVLVFVEQILNKIEKSNYL